MALKKECWGLLFSLSLFYFFLYILQADVFGLFLLAKFAMVFFDDKLLFDNRLVLDILPTGDLIRILHLFLQTDFIFTVRVNSS